MKIQPPRFLPPLLVLLFCTCGPARMHAQPQTDPIRVVKNITPFTNAMGRRWTELVQSNQGEKAYAVRDSIMNTLLGEYVTASYLVDRHGTVWALGTMDVPFVIHTYSLECYNCHYTQNLVNQLATEYADEVITFVLLPTPKEDSTRAIIEKFNDDVVVLYDDHFRNPYQYPNDARLLGLVGYGHMHFITPDRRIVGLDGFRYIHPGKGDKRKDKKMARERDVLRRWRIGAERLLAFPR